jgi:hypothetical protein
LEPTCKTWFQQPTRDPRRPENTIGKGHQHKYKESCLQRILEQSFSTDALHTLSLEDIKTTLDAYLKHTMTEEEYTELLANYYTPDYLETYYQQLVENRPMVVRPPPPPTVATAALPPRFDAIKDILKKRKLIRMYRHSISTTISPTRSFQPFAKHSPTPPSLCQKSIYHWWVSS